MDEDRQPKQPRNSADTPSSPAETDQQSHITDKKVPVESPAYHGKTLSLAGICILNLLLNLCTLFVYSFWGKTRIRRYVTSHISLAKDRFEYTGTGMELFTGFLKALLIYFPIAFALEIPGVNLLALPVLLGLITVAFFLALRYRLSRTRWRGIRFSLGGLVKEYFWLAIKRGFFNIISIGYKIPKSDIMLWTYVANHMKYGEVTFTYNGDYKRLMRVHLITLALCLAAFVGGVSYIAYSSRDVSFGKLYQGYQDARKLDEAKKKRDEEKLEKILEGLFDKENAHQSPVVPYGRFAQAEMPDVSVDDFDSTEDNNNLQDQAYPPMPEAETEKYDCTLKEHRKKFDCLTEDEKKQRLEQIEKYKNIGDFGSFVLKIIGLIYGTIFVIIVARIWYSAALWQEKFRGLKLDGLRFKCSFTGRGLFWLYTSNLLITIGLALTLVGLLFAKPITMQRTLKYYLKNLKIGGDLDALMVEQNKNAKPTGFGDALAADVGFDIGL